MKCLEFKGANKSQETVNYSDQHCNNILDSGGDKVSRDITLNCADTCQDSVPCCSMTVTTKMKVM